MGEPEFFPEDPSSVDLDSMIAESEPVTLRRPASRIGELTPREMEVFRLVAQGLSTVVIANRLTLSTHTVQNHIHNIIRKLEVRSRGEAVDVGLRAGLASR